MDTQVCIQVVHEWSYVEHTSDLALVLQKALCWDFVSLESPINSQLPVKILCSDG
jgi:hypothetical protein